MSGDIVGWRVASKASDGARSSRRRRKRVINCGNSEVTCERKTDVRENKAQNYACGSAIVVDAGWGNRDAQVRYGIRTSTDEST